MTDGQSRPVDLSWRQVDLGRAEVQFLETKNGDPRGVPLHPRVIAELAGLKHRDGEVFRRPDGLPYARKCESGGQIKTAFFAACRRAGITDFSPHDCRHTWATWHCAASRDPIAIDRLAALDKTREVARR